MNTYELLKTAMLTEAISPSSIKNELQKVKQEIDALMLRGGSLGHGSVLPQYIDQMKRLRARQRSLRDQLNQLRDESVPISDWQRQHADRMNDPKDKAMRHGQSISMGLQQGNQLRKDLGGYGGIARDILNNIEALTDNGTKPLEFEVLSDKYGVNVRTLHKWFERPEFIKLRRFMPYMYR